jgi:hypothetical protein
LLTAAKSAPWTATAVGCPIVETNGVPADDGKPAVALPR